jgi:hypothetical protein
MPSLETAARSLKVVPIVAPFHSDAEIEMALRPLGASREAGLSSCRMEPSTLGTLTNSRRAAPVFIAIL